MVDVHALTLSDVTRRVKSGALTARGVAEAMLARIERMDASLGAYVTVLGDRALAQADALDAARQRGEPLGLLHGAPIALKDLLTTKGIPTTCGTAVLRDWRPTVDATIVTRLEAAGAIVLGKVKLTEGAFGEHHPSVDPPRNPWRDDRWTGVSSSGSGVAVAAGLAHGAIGTDTGGSIRFPSAACGLVGIKPTYGRVSRHGAFPLSETLDHVGPMTRSVEDAARMLQVMAGRDAKDPTSLDAPVPAYGPSVRDNLAGARIGVDWNFVGDGVHESVTEAVRDALGVLSELGAEVVDVNVPDTRTLVDGWYATCGADCVRAHADTFPARKDEYGPALANLLEAGLRVAPEEYARLERERASFRTALEGLLGGVDAVIAPCMVGPIPPAERSAEPRPARDQSPQRPSIAFTAPFDYSGHPTITLPLDLDADGLPRAFQLIGRLLDEPGLIGIAGAFERAAEFAYPPLSL